MKKNPKDILFGEVIDFDEILHDIGYIKEKELVDTKLYTGMDFTIVEIIDKGDTSYKPSAYRKFIFHKQCGSGIVIGSKIKKEGLYHPQTGCSFTNNYEDYEQAYLEVTNTQGFWVIATRMNETLLIPKNI